MGGIPNLPPVSSGNIKPIVCSISPWKTSRISPSALPVIKPFQNAKIKIIGVGFVPKTDTTGRPAFPSLKLDYAHKLIETGAFVANKDYQVVSGMDESTLEMIVVELIPVDPALKKHFNDCMQA